MSYGKAFTTIQAINVEPQRRASRQSALRLTHVPCVLPVPPRRAPAGGPFLRGPVMPGPLPHLPRPAALPVPRDGLPAAVRRPPGAARRAGLGGGPMGRALPTAVARGVCSCLVGWTVPWHCGRVG